MPWQEVNTVDLRVEFVTLAKCRSLSFSELCARYHISRKTGYKWLRRYQQQGLSGLSDQSRRPKNQPRRTPEDKEALILACRQRYPDWGGRKLRRVLQDQGHLDLPSPSTMTEILRRHGLLHTEQPAQANFIRFEHPHPNDLWQMDFKGHFSLPRGRCHPLTILDDHSRYSLCLNAYPGETAGLVKRGLIQTFERYGIPRRMTMDNGSPWGSGASGQQHTQLTVWLMEQGINVGHSRPYHPQTQGKDERFHRTLKRELLGRRQFNSLAHCQRSFDTWRQQYNRIRPHDSLGLDTPATHYEPSTRSYRPNLPPYEYGSNDQVRKVGRNLVISFERYQIFLGKPFEGKKVAVRPTVESGTYTLHYCHQQVGKFDLGSMAKRKK